jgi:hypothetical protein
VEYVGVFETVGYEREREREREGRGGKRRKKVEVAN